MYTCQHLDTKNVMATTNTAVRSYSNKDYQYVNHCTFVITQNNLFLILIQFWNYTITTCKQVTHRVISRPSNTSANAHFKALFIYTHRNTLWSNLQNHNKMIINTGNLSNTQTVTQSADQYRPPKSFYTCVCVSE